MTDTDTTPPPLLRAAALMSRAATRLADAAKDLDAAIKDLETARDSLPEEERYRVAHLLTGARVRRLDANTGAHKLPELAFWAEELAPTLPASTAQEGGAT